MAIVTDIETVAVDGFDIEPIAAPANYKDPEKIAAYIAQAEAAQREKAALYPWTSRVVALGTASGDHDPSVVVITSEAEEREALTWFWRSIVHEDDARFVRPLIGFNHRTFDLPVLMARSTLLGVPYQPLNLDRYRSPHVDLLDRLTFFGSVPARSLHWFARRFGLPVDDTVRGADVAGLVVKGDWEAVRAHCASDVQLTRALAQRLGLMRGGKVTGD